MKKVFKTLGNLKVCQKLKNKEVSFKFYLALKTKYYLQ
jgi:hypothetical protein